jgi:hypothetical protein
MAKAWGIPTWLFFHTFVANFPPEKYDALKEGLLFNVKNVFANLPCPDCSKHATEAMAFVKLSNIPTLESFKSMLWTLHNTVNARTRKPLFKYEDLTIYERCDLATLYKVFMREMKKPSNNSKLMMDVMARQNVLKRFDAWIRENNLLLQRHGQRPVHAPPTSP